jgi:hypothetical protein
MTILICHLSLTKKQKAKYFNMEKYKILLCLLTHHKIDKLKRLIKSVKQIQEDSLIELEPIIIVNTLNDNYYKEVLNEGFPFKIIRTKSNGKPGMGKNSCRELFLKSDADFLSQVDGDDWLYPTWAKSISQHIYQYPNLDVLGLLPVDLVSNNERGGHMFSCGFNNQYYGCVWGISLVNRPSHGAGEGHWVNHQQPQSFDRIVLQSKLSAIYKMSEYIPNGEDHLYSIKLLSLHQKRKIRYFTTMSSDLYIHDCTLDDNIQKIFSQTDYVEEMKKEMFKHVLPWRSSQEELPVIFNELLLSQEAKAIYIKETF